MIFSYIWLKSDGRGGKKQPLSQALQPNLSDGMLQFDKLSMNHDGYYVCQACFDKEFLESDEVKLTVSMAGGKEKNVYMYIHVYNVHAEQGSLKND